ncbi:hypothetical protein QDR37_01135 [Amnibacterium sp. CER49]|uniref:hypothetical protein n=1 Tax=Amnibacterium sp. CER49 TaxID=3039161 RepID=UPI00244A94F4|nr:hypothetical protein [Amnibacterium sp. CER49]MDH2442539.1 hypothetical protein [Amnibacterium sp. CER49]
MSGVLAWVAAPAFFIPTVSALVVAAITGAVKPTRRVWAVLFRTLGRGAAWAASFRLVHKSRVRPHRPAPLKPVRWIAAQGPGPDQVRLVNTASGVARNVRVDDNYSTKVLDDAQWELFPQQAVFKCAVDRFQGYASVKVSWSDERGDPQPTESVEVQPF